MKKTNIDLIPDCQNQTPDYYCTWQTQLYATSDGKPAGQRAVIGERALFEKEKPYGWAYFYEEARRDLFLVMDDSWDVPPDGDPRYYGSLQLDGDKFPAAVGGSKSNAEALKRLSDRIKALGWRGLGGWVCAQESACVADADKPEAYWTARLREANAAGMSFWKVDWGERGRDLAFRRMLTDLGHVHAPALIIEHACINEAVPYSDVFRTYDVPAILSIPMTLQKLCNCMAGNTAAPGYAGLINCEDEPYTAAAGGFSMGIMRHPYAGPLPNGRADMSFPALHRDIKTKLYEVIRAARWHRIAPAFGVNARELAVSPQVLQDDWRFEDLSAELESWWLPNGSLFDRMGTEGMAASAPAAIARRMPLPTVLPDENSRIPYLVAAKNPNGAVSIATLGRTQGRTYGIPHCDITAETGDGSLIGIFGEYKSLTLRTSHKAIKTVLMQDVAGDHAYDVTDRVALAGGSVTIPGELIHTVGREAQPGGDTSAPGVVLQLVPADAPAKP